jgi:predicted nucleic acid-binding protein
VVRGSAIFVKQNGPEQVDMIIVDTDILIDAGRNVNEAVNCLQQIEQRFSVAVSSVTQMELIIGCRNKNELHSLEQFIERFHIISLDEQISDTAIDLLKQYRLSHGLLIADALIAATAIISDLSFVSKNQSDYRFIEDLQLLPYPDPFQ